MGGAGLAGRGSSWGLSCRASQRGKRLALNAGFPGLNKGRQGPSGGEGQPCRDDRLHGAHNSAAISLGPPVGEERRKGERSTPLPRLTFHPSSPLLGKTRGEGLNPNQVRSCLEYLDWTFKI